MQFPRRDFLALSAVGGTMALCGTPAAAAQPHEAWREKLAGHRIKSIESDSVQMHWPRLVGKNARLDVHGRGPRVGICKITTDQGAFGWGAIRGNRADLERAVHPALNRRVSDLLEISSGILNPTLEPIDFALHDLAGVILEIPVYQMLGASGPPATQCYSGMIYFDDLHPPEKPAGIDQVLANCQADVDYGYQQLKVKIGRGNRWLPRKEGIRRDIEVTRAIAEKFPDVEILVDGNDGFEIDTFIEYLEGIGEVPLFWIEEPFRETVDDYRKLRQWLRAAGREALLADGEAGPDWRVLEELSQQHLLDVQLVDVVGYGFTSWRKLMPTLKQRKIMASPHAWGDALKTNYVAHLARGLGNVVTIEGVTCQSEDVDFGDYRLEEGKLVTSAEPGFGMRLL